MLHALRASPRCLTIMLANTAGRHFNACQNDEARHGSLVSKLQVVTVQLLAIYISGLCSQFKLKAEASSIPRHRPSINRVHLSRTPHI